MKKNLIIGLLTVVSLASLTFGYLQKQRADEQEALAVENEKVAREALIRAEQSEKEAELQRRLAMANEHRAMKAMSEASKEKVN